MICEAPYYGEETSLSSCATMPCDEAQCALRCVEKINEEGASSICSANYSSNYSTTPFYGDIAAYCYSGYNRIACVEPCTEYKCCYENCLVNEPVQANGVCEVSNDPIKTHYLTVSAWCAAQCQDPSTALMRF